MKAGIQYSRVNWKKLYLSSKWLAGDVLLLDGWRRAWRNIRVDCYVVNP
jgi:hypothetical protein